MITESEGYQDYRGFVLDKVITYEEFEDGFIHTSNMYSKIIRFNPYGIDVQMKDGVFATIGFVSAEDANRYRNWYIDNVLHN